MPDIGERGGNTMKKTIDFEMPIGELTRVKDFLPAPSELAIHDETQKITISLKKSSVNFFRRQAKLHRTKYQRMIRELLDRYALLYGKN